MRTKEQDRTKDLVAGGDEKERLFPVAVGEQMTRYARRTRVKSDPTRTFGCKMSPPSSPQVNLTKTPTTRILPIPHQMSLRVYQLESERRSITKWTPEFLEFRETDVATDQSAEVVTSPVTRWTPESSRTRTSDVATGTSAVTVASTVEKMSSRTRPNDHQVAPQPSSPHETPPRVATDLPSGGITFALLLMRSSLPTRA